MITVSNPILYSGRKAKEFPDRIWPRLLLRWQPVPDPGRWGDFALDQFFYNRSLSRRVRFETGHVSRVSRRVPDPNAG